MNRKLLVGGVAASAATLVLLGAAGAATQTEADPNAVCVDQAAGVGAEFDYATVKGTADERNVTTIISVGRSLNVPERGITIAIATTLVETGGRNLASERVPESKQYANDGVAPGDHMSIGIMQQQVGMGWFDTVANGMKPEVQAESFYRALLKVGGWESMGFSAAAQAVQRSAFPSRYGQREAEATALYRQLASGAPVVPASGTVGGTCPGSEGDSEGGVVGAVVVSGRWANPLKPAAYVFTSPFGPRMDPVLHIPKPHKGQDLSAPTGTPVYMVCDGVVAAAGWDAWGGGNMTTLNCGGNVVVKLMHQSRITVTKGQQVAAGQEGGYVGSTGNSTGSHLHVQVELDGKATNPVPFFIDRGVPL